VLVAPPGSLGIALPLHGGAVRARALNHVSVAASVVMNVLAASPGCRALAIWAMPPVAYALASDTMTAVVRARARAGLKPITRNQGRGLQL
jgi:hypothetical protein